MKKLVSAILASGLAGIMMIPAPASAASVKVNMGQQQRYVSERCIEHPNWRGCDDWRRNHNRWSSNDYRNWYRWNQPNLGNVAAGIFGFAVGAAIVGSMNRNVDRYSGFDSHVAACEARYRSYNAETDMFLGYDGRYHRCNL
ncbi:BA14K family protein [Devosia sp.]|uniref:BA14K family protein n=1 Tax=Devosia sp. TaxID=1871048 RepID=UPI003F724044